MLKFLLPILAPGAALPQGDNAIHLEADGLSWGWAFFLFVIISILVIWSYRRFAAGVSFFTRSGLILLRLVLVFLILLIVVRPVLMLTVEKSVRRPLLVLLDLTQSMGLKDHRSQPQDLVRAAIAQGTADPAGGVEQSAGASAAGLRDISRGELLEDLAANDRLKFWPQIFDRADLVFYGMGRGATKLGELKPLTGSTLTTADSLAFFRGQHYQENLTALGDSLSQVLDQERGQSVAGVLLISDGANNSGTPPLEAAEMARSDGVPLYTYGVGVTSPQDIIVSELVSPQTTNLKEKLNVTVWLRAQNLLGKTATVQLMADGKQVDQQSLEFRTNEQQELTMSYTPDKVGQVKLEAVVPPLPEETVKDNNSASAQVRVVDDKFNVLLIGQQPGWDFQYLLAMLQRDRRVKLSCFIVGGDLPANAGPDSPFIDKLPETKEDLFKFDLIIIGDVDPAAIGETRMGLLNEWVSKIGGGLILMAGPRFNPSRYGETQLKPLYPVEVGSNGPSDYYPAPVKLRLTPSGESSPLLLLSPTADENDKIWNNFPGVTWTANVGAARPGASVYLTDPTESRASQAGPMPVMAQQAYGLGQILYVGFNQTYRWRSHQGEKYYTQIWGQVLQGLCGQRAQGSSALTQLKTDRPRYLEGDRVTISARVFKASFDPFTDPDLPGTLVFQPETPPGKPVPPPTTSDFHLQPVPDKPGEYGAQMSAKQAGTYTFTTVRDPAVVLKFDVAALKVEMADTAMNEELLKAMASTSGGRFLREENLHELPALLASKSAVKVSYQKIPISFSPYFLLLMLAAGCLEWYWRRRLELK